LVNDSHFHCYIPDLYEVSTALLKGDKKSDYNLLKSSVDLHLETLFKDKKVKLIIDKVLGIDLEKKSVKLQKDSLEYDYLVVALGSSSAFFGIPGADNFSHPLKTAEDALNIRNDLYELVQSAKGEGKSLNVVIAGGGFTGVELSGAMGPLLQKHGSITVVEATGNVLGGMPKWAQVDALKKLKSLKVDVRLNCAIKKVENDKLMIEGGEEIAFDYLIWTAGVKGIDLKDGVLGIELGKKSQIPVKDDLSVEGFPEVFVVGDFAQIGNPEKGFVPQAAWAAIAEAETAARNIRLTINDERLTSFVSPKSQFVVPIGERFALTNAFGFQIEGIIAWFIKLFITLRYFVLITSVGTALRIWKEEVEVDIMEH
jgi:NADH:ubiquinone reductase (H+-translocating)